MSDTSISLLISAPLSVLLCSDKADIARSSQNLLKIWWITQLLAQSYLFLSCVVSFANHFCDKIKAFKIDVLCNSLSYSTFVITE
jgi:hypothetical protein